MVQLLLERKNINVLTSTESNKLGTTGSHVLAQGNEATKCLYPPDKNTF